MICTCSIPAARQRRGFDAWPAGRAAANPRCFTGRRM